VFSGAPLNSPPVGHRVHTTPPPSWCPYLLRRGYVEFHSHTVSTKTLVRPTTPQFTIPQSAIRVSPSPDTVTPERAFELPSPLLRR